MYSTSGLPREIALPITQRSGAGLQILFAKAFVPLDAQRIEKRRGGRIHVHVRASDAKAALLQHPGHRSHGRAGDAEQVDVFGIFVEAIPFMELLEAIVRRCFALAVCDWS